MQRLNYKKLEIFIVTNASKFDLDVQNNLFNIVRILPCLSPSLAKKIFTSIRNTKSKNLSIELKRIANHVKRNKEMKEFFLFMSQCALNIEKHDILHKMILAIYANSLKNSIWLSLDESNYVVLLRYLKQCNSYNRGLKAILH